MNDRSRFDPYQLRPEYARNPPRGFVGTYRMIGPGLILAGGLVGSGELVATTVLGAENGYRLLWLILVSCTIKTVVQNELGRYSIGTGKRRWRRSIEFRVHDGESPGWSGCGA